jgi:hypothetical protein
MSKITSSLKLKGAAAALALALSLGALTPAGAYSYSGFQPIATHDYWRSFSVQVDGVPGAGAATEIGKDRMAAFLFLNDHQLVMTLSAKPWNFKPNDEVAVKITIQGKEFAITAHAVSQHELSLDVTHDGDFIHSLANADQLSIQVKGESWDLNLGGLNQSITEAWGAIKKIDASL